MMCTGRIFDLQPFSLHDGPGTRTTVFMQGCNLHCAWCHNPESQPLCGALIFYPTRCIACGACAATCPNAAEGRSARHTQKCMRCGVCARACYAEAVTFAGRTITLDDLLEKLCADRTIYASSDGGVTFSGGEPLLQPDFVGAALLRLKAEGIHTAVETALNVPWRDVETIMGAVDLFYVDLKCVSDETHRAGTGVGNARIHANMRRLSVTGAHMILRTPVVPGFNANDAEMDRIARFVAALPNRHAVELLAYHGMCAPKYAALGRPFPCAGTKEPDEAEIERYADILRARKIDVTYTM